MSSAQSIFFYGVFIETAQLCFAADAYKKSKGSLLGIDLICARRRKGELSATSSQVKAIPVEVWRLIKLEVIGNAMAQAEQSEISDLLRDWEDDGDFDNDHLSSTWEDVGMYNLNRFYGDSGMSMMLDCRSKVSVSLFRPLSAALTLPFYDDYRRSTTSSKHSDSSFLSLNLTAKPSLVITTFMLFPQSASLFTQLHLLPTFTLSLAFSTKRLHNAKSPTNQSVSQTKLSTSLPTPAVASPLSSPSSVFKQQIRNLRRSIVPNRSRKKKLEKKSRGKTRNCQQRTNRGVAMTSRLSLIGKCGPSLTLVEV